MSNCPSGPQGGNLGQIGRGDTAPEFERALFRPGPPGLLREVVKTRFGFHIVAIDRRIPGARLPFEIVRERIAERLPAAVEEKALRQYVSVLAGGPTFGALISTRRMFRSSNNGGRRSLKETVRVNEWSNARRFDCPARSA